MIASSGSQREEARALSDSHDFWNRYRDHHWAEIERAKRNRLPLPDPLPHPDDIVIEPGRAVRVNGPIDEAEAEKYDESCRMRDTLLLQDAVDQKVEQTQQEGDGAYQAGGAVVFALWLNRRLPKRFQLSESAFVWRTMRNQATSKRELLRSVHQSWRSLGRQMPRGKRFASLTVVVGCLRFFEDMMAAFEKGEIDVEAMAQGIFNEAALKLMDKHGIAAG